MIHPELLLLIIIANGVPVIAYDLLGVRFAWPVDLGWRMQDGEPLLGESKTWRGILLSMPVTAAAGVLLGIQWQTGLIVAIAAMAGDCLSSFIKRRLKMASGSFAPGIDQIPESLLPLLAVADAFKLSAEQVALTVIAFIVLELVLSRILYRFRLRKHPY